MKKFLAAMAALLTAALVLIVVMPASANTAIQSEGSGTVDAAAAKQAYLDQKCNLCHAVAAADIEATTKSEKMKGPDLGGIDKDIDWMVKYLNKEEKLDGETHKKGFTGSDEDLRQVLAWLKAL